MTGFTSRVVDPSEFDGNLLTALRAAQAENERLHGCIDAEAKVRIMMTEAADYEAARAEAAEARVRDMEDYNDSLAMENVSVSELLDEFRARVRELEEGLRPFANYADQGSSFPDAFKITFGSHLAKRQLTIGDCRAARALLDKLSKATPSESEHV